MKKFLFAFLVVFFVSCMAGTESSTATADPIYERYEQDVKVFLTNPRKLKLKSIPDFLYESMKQRFSEVGIAINISCSWMYNGLNDCGFQKNIVTPKSTLNFLNGCMDVLHRASKKIKNNIKLTSGEKSFVGSHVCTFRRTETGCQGFAKCFKSGDPSFYITTALSE